MALLIDLAAYSALRTRGNLKVAYETKLMQELGTKGYSELKAQMREERDERAWKMFRNLVLLATIPVSWPIVLFLIVRWCVRNDDVSSN